MNSTTRPGNQDTVFRRGRECGWVWGIWGQSKQQPHEKAMQHTLTHVHRYTQIQKRMHTCACSHTQRNPSMHPTTLTYTNTHKYIYMYIYTVRRKKMTGSGGLTLKPNTSARLIGGIHIQDNSDNSEYSLQQILMNNHHLIISHTNSWKKATISEWIP